MRSFAAPLVLVFALGGCGTGIAAGADFRPGTTFSGYTTFAWDDDAIRRGGDVRLENNPYFEEHLFAAVAAELSARGIREADTNPDVLAHYHLSVEDHIEVYEANPESGYPAPPPGTPPGTQVVQFQEGTFVLHFVNARTGDNLWIGWAQGEIGPALASSAAMQEWVNEAVAKMFELFPG
jgi:hypothetical protein